MIKVLAVSILLTAVYSWEEFKRTIWVLLYGAARKQKPLRYYAAHADRFVSIAVMLFTVPLGLLYLAGGSQSLAVKLSLLTFGLLGVSAVAAASSIIARNFKLASYGFEKISPISFSLASLVAPTFAVFSDVTLLPRKILSRFAFLLSLPPAIGFGLKYMTDRAIPSAELLPHTDALIFILVGALFAQMTISLLGPLLGRFRYRRLSVYFRIILGIILSSALFF